MSEVPWGQSPEAYKAIHDKIDEVLAKLDNPTDPQTAEILVGKTFKTAKISQNTSGDNEIVSAVSGKKIKVYVVVLNVAGTVSCKWRSATNDLTGAMPLQAREGYTVSVAPPAFVLVTNQGEALNLNLSAAVFAYGWVAYWDDDS